MCWSPVSREPKSIICQTHLFPLCVQTWRTKLINPGVPTRSTFSHTFTVWRLQVSFLKRTLTTGNVLKAEKPIQVVVEVLTNQLQAAVPYLYNISLWLWMSLNSSHRVQVESCVQWFYTVAQLLLPFSASNETQQHQRNKTNVSTDCWQKQVKINQW